jgi:hypothetical protein
MAKLFFLWQNFHVRKQSTIQSSLCTAKTHWGPGRPSVPHL